MASLDIDDTKAAILDCHVCIVGAGIGGLMMGILLERADIKYTILEKHPFHNPLGNPSIPRDVFFFLFHDPFSTSYVRLFRHKQKRYTRPGTNSFALLIIVHFTLYHIKRILCRNIPMRYYYHYTGSAICLEPSVQPLFRQLGLMDEIHRLSKPFGAMIFREDNLNIIGTFSAQTPLDINDR